MVVDQYVSEINERCRSGDVSERMFEGDLRALIEGLIPEISVTPQDVCGLSPYYKVMKRERLIGSIEIKRFDLKGIEEGCSTPPPMIKTDYLHFEFYRERELITHISIAEVTNEGVILLSENIAIFEALIIRFCAELEPMIKSPQKLATLMAGHAHLLALLIESALVDDERLRRENLLMDQWRAFNRNLPQRVNVKAFSDAYAQMVAYGLFVARWITPNSTKFSRSEPATLIAKSTPALRGVFEYIGGTDLDDRLKWVIDDLAEICVASDVQKLLKEYAQRSGIEEPIVHFYETFLAKYDPNLRRKRGVWFTPTPVVRFIISAVDELLKHEFNIFDGLADTLKVPPQVSESSSQHSPRGGRWTHRAVHRVQVLDPSTGTGTFLTEIISYIKQRVQDLGGDWKCYIERDLLPRLTGYELLMAPYVMAHLNLELLLRESGYSSTHPQGVRVYLKNCLEEPQTEIETVSAQWASNKKSDIGGEEREKSILCVIGNPPYRGESSNQSPWIMRLMEDYKREPEGHSKLKERNPKWVNDDYVKFLRYGQHLIERRGAGVVAFITPHGFLDNPTFRGVRWSLLKTYDLIYIIDLHGNAKRKERAIDGGVDVNIFDIMQGVAISLLVKTGQKKRGELAKVLHHDVYGKRAHKYAFLSTHTLQNIPFKVLENRPPHYFMTKKNFKSLKSYERGVSIQSLFTSHSVGVITARDRLVIDRERAVLKERIRLFFELDPDELFKRFGVREKSSWSIEQIQSEALRLRDEDLLRISYRPFDDRFIYYNKRFIERPRAEMMRHLRGGDNIGLSLCKQVKSGSNYHHVFVTKQMIESGYVSNQTSEITSVFPLYVYPNIDSSSPCEGVGERVPNFNPEQLSIFAQKVDLTFTEEATSFRACFAPIDLFDYIYAILHAPSYRSKYKELLRVDFPLIPYPQHRDLFWRLVTLGGGLRRLHLLTSSKLGTQITSYPIMGHDTITTRIAKRDWVLFDEERQLGRIWINDEQYFDDVPSSAWTLSIGSYKPAQKWLKDRRGSALTLDDRSHYQKMVTALFETDKLMREIDRVLESER